MEIEEIFAPTFKTKKMGVKFYLVFCINFFLLRLNLNFKIKMIKKKLKTCLRIKSVINLMTFFLKKNMLLIYFLNI